MKYLRKPIALLLVVIMGLMAMPLTSMITFAEPTPVASGTLNIVPEFKEYVTLDSPDKGWNSSPRDYRFTNIVDFTSDNTSGADDTVTGYCINHGGKFRGEDLTKYLGYRPDESKYFSEFTESQQKGILLTAMFGHPAVDWRDLVYENGTRQDGDTISDAIAATQALLWEFNLGTRTSFELNARNSDWAYNMVAQDKGAERAYTRILSSAQRWLDEGHDWEKLLNDPNMIVWENGETAQVMLTYSGRPIDPFGSISIKKVDENGNGLEGAVFTIYDENGALFEVLEPTSVDNDYTAKTGDINEPDTVPYGTYRIIETKAPAGYKPSQTGWTVVVDEEHKHVQFVVDNLAERELKIHKTSKTTDGKTGTKHISDKVFFVYDYTTSGTIGGLIGSLTTDANGNTTALKLTSNESGQYAIKEAVTDNYTPSALNGYATKKIGGDTYFIIDKSQFAKNGNGVYSFTLDVVNEYIQYGKIQIKKELDVAGKSLKGFYFELYDSKGNIAIDNNTGLEIKGYTNDKGFLTLASDVKKCEIGKTIRSLSDLATVTYGDLYDFTDAEERAALEALGIKESDFVDEFLAGFTSTKALAITDIYFLNENIPTSTLVSWFNSKFSNNWLVYNLDGENVLSPDSTTSKNDLWGLMLEINGVVVGMLYTSPFSSVTEFSVEPGEYTIKETLTENQKADYKSDADSLTKTFEVKAYSTTNVQTVTFLNKSKSAAIKIVKTSEDGVLAGFKFKIEGPNGFSYTTEATDNSGVLYINENIIGADIVAGEYTITEINVPGRYNTPIAQTIEFSTNDINNTDGVTKTVSFNNTLKTYQLTIKKESEDGIVRGIQFNVVGTDIKGNFIEAIVTTGSGDNADNTATLDGLYPGTYYITEIMTEDGRYVIPDAKELVITENSVNTVTFQNVLKKFTVELTKKPAAGAIYGDSSLEGAEYGLYKDGVLIESKVVTVTNGVGKITFSEQVCGEGYYVQEIKAPEGFYLDKNIYTVNADANSVYSEHNIIYVNVTDVEITGKITIYKLKGTEDNNVPEAGAIFHVYLKSAGAYIPNAPDTVAQDFIVTDREDPNDPMGYFGGIATTKELPYGTYIVKQVYGDERFELAEPFEVVIDAEHTSETYTVLNKTTVKPVTITKQDITGTKNLPGAELKLVDEDGNEYTGTTDENGQYVFTVWPAKSYTLTELVAPEGYVLTSEAVTFTLDIYGEVIE
ncbi:MAG: Cys-Gln thioester bond-forming surface protein, partial [Clostridia bacterium]|nr:Cys-Gln thioester bond-forming surface protein [Clostridia bacterium]